MQAIERVRTALTALNTHRIFGVGMVTGGVSIAILVTAPIARVYIGAHPSRFGGIIGAQTLLAYINVATEWATAVAGPALIAAGFGRPINIPGSPAAAPTPPSAIPPPASAARVDPTRP